MIFLLQPGLEKTLNKENRKTKEYENSIIGCKNNSKDAKEYILNTALGSFISYKTFCFYEMEINKKIEYKSDLISIIHDIIAKHIQLEYADIVLSVTSVTMKDFLTTFKYEIAKFQYLYLYNRDYLKLFLNKYRLHKYYTIKVIDCISIYPVIIDENSHNTLLELIQSKEIVDNEYIEAVKRSLNIDMNFIKRNYERNKFIEINIINMMLQHTPNLYTCIYNFINKL